MSLQPMSYPFKSLASRMPDSTISVLKMFELDGGYAQLERCISFVEETRRSFVDLEDDQAPDQDIHTFLMERGEESLKWLINFIGTEEAITSPVQTALSDLVLWLDELDHLLRGFFQIRELKTIY